MLVVAKPCNSSRSNALRAVAKQRPTKVAYAIDSMVVDAGGKVLISQDRGIDLDCRERHVKSRRLAYDRCLDQSAKVFAAKPYRSRRTPSDVIEFGLQRYDRLVGSIGADSSFGPEGGRWVLMAAK